MAVEPTEIVDGSRVHYPYLRKRLAAATTDESNGARLDHASHSDKITVAISPAGYSMTFINSEPFGTGGVQWFLMEGVGIDVAGEGKREERMEKVKEKLVRNNSWMRDLRREDVEGKKEAFRRDLEQVRGLDEEGDVSMDEA